jgi:hypothetical protein
MGLRASTPFLFGPTRTKIWPLNADLSTPVPVVQGSPADIIATGGVGPFDFSGEANTAAVPLTVKIDAAAAETQTIDVSTGVGSVDESAVTATELAAAIEAANAAAGFVGVTATVAASGRIQIAIDVVGTSRYLMVYGAAAKIALFGQGLGLQPILLDTQESVSQSPTVVAAESISTQDTNGLITEVLTDPYRNGSTGTLTDTAFDLALKAMLEGGTLASDGDFYEAPNSESTLIYFAIEIVQPYFSRGTNKESDLVGYVLKRILTCYASPADEAGDRSFQSQGYNYTATEYKDPSGNLYGDTVIEKFTKAEYEALTWDSIA